MVLKQVKNVLLLGCKFVTETNMYISQFIHRGNNKMLFAEIINPQQCSLVCPAGSKGDL